jgi:hypothetical protein
MSSLDQSSAVDLSRSFIHRVVLFSDSQEYDYENEIYSFVSMKGIFFPSFALLYCMAENFELWDMFWFYSGSFLPVVTFIMHFDYVDKSAFNFTRKKKSLLYHYHCDLIVLIFMLSALLR